MAEEPTMAELDAAALMFLEELAADDIEVEHDAPVAHAHAELPPDDALLLSTLLASPIEGHGTVDAPAMVPQLLPLELSDDEAASAVTDTDTLVVSSRYCSLREPEPKPVKVKRKKPNRSPNYIPNRARNERRHELIHLKRVIGEMEQELGRLRIAQAGAVTEACTRQQRQLQQYTTGALPTPSPDASVWERVAVRQLNERRRSECENERLKALLEAQLKIARSLEHTLHKRTIVQGIEEARLGSQRRVFANSSVPSDNRVFEELLRQVHRVYLDAESHFERMGIGSTETSCRDARRRNACAIEMEIFANEVLPFGLQAVGKAAWQYFSHDKNHLPFRLYYERFAENSNVSEDTIIESSGLELHTNSVKSIYNLKQVLRRYVEPDRVVIAYSAIAEPVEFANKPVRGCHFREYGCMVLQRPVVHDPTTHTVVKTCFFFIPEQHRGNASANDERLVQELTDFNFRSTIATLAAWLQRIENILVADHFGSGGRTMR